MTIKKIKAIMNDNELNKLNHNFDYLSESHRRIQTQINDLVLDAGESNQEVVQARGGHQVLNDRLNSIDSQLAQTQNEINRLDTDKASKEEFYKEMNKKSERSYVNAKVGEVNNRIDEIITSPAEGISEQEIIDAREGKTSLGANVRDVRTKTSTGIVNKVKNGDFSSGTENHLVFGGELEVIDGNAISTGTGTFSTFGGVIAQDLADTLPDGDIWYIKARLRTLEDDTRSLLVGFRGTSGYTHNVITDPIKDRWYELSHTYSGGGSLTGLFRTSITGMWSAGQNVGKRIEVDYYLAINLSESFGRGYEPTKEEMDEILSNFGYFDEDSGSGKLSFYLLEKRKEMVKTQSELEGKVKQAKESELENIIVNGDFSNGKEGWTSSSGTLSTVQNGKLIITGTSSHPTPRVFQEINKPYTIGDKLYLSAEFTPGNSDCDSVGFAVYSDLSGENDITYLTTSDISVDQMTKLSGIVDVVSDTGNMRVQVRSTYEDASIADGKEVAVDNIMAFNLTRFFGKGNEPNVDAFERMLSIINVDSSTAKTDLAKTQKALTEYVLERTENISGRTSAKPLAVISFDDHWLSDYEKAFPFLEARGIKGTSYVITSQVGAPGKMDWEHLRELKKAGWNIEFHTHNHINLSTSSDSEIRADFEQGIQTFLDNGFPKPRHLAYPYGAGTDSDRVKNVIGEYMKTARNSRAYLAGVNNRYNDIDFLRLNGLSIDMNEHRQDRLEKIKNMMKRSAENGEIVLLYGHKLVDDGPTNDNIPETIFSEWAELVDYAIDLDFEFVTQDEMYLRVLHSL